MKETKESMLEGLGSVPIWGYSHALDLQNLDENVYLEKHVKNDETPISSTTPNSEPYRILLLGNSDIRHVIKTICQAWRHGSRPLHFHLLETQSSILARHILTLKILFDESLELSIRERVEMFMEVYGNMFVTSKTYIFIKTESSNLIRTITDDLTDALSTRLDLSLLKFREKDDLEFVFKFWRDDTKRLFPMDKFLEARLRKLYGNRYDYRENAVDWDYHMKLSPKSPKIYKPEFLRFRLHGTSFVFREQSYTKPNRTMATVDMMKVNGVSVSKWGYFSDVAIGPWMAFGLDSEEKSLLEVRNRIHVKTSQQIMERNLEALMHEALTGTMYCPIDPESLQEGTTDKITEIFDEIEELSQKQAPDQPTEDEPSRISFQALPEFKITFLPTDPATLLEPTSSKFKNFQGFFDVAVIGHALAHRVANIHSVLKPGTGQVVVESSKYLTELSPEAQSAYLTQVMQLARGLDRPASDRLVLKLATLSETDLRNLDVLVFVREMDVIAGGISTRVMDPKEYTIDYEKIGRALPAQVSASTPDSRSGLIKKDSKVDIMTDKLSELNVDDDEKDISVGV